jgi:hypothetical protein
MYRDRLYTTLGFTQSSIWEVAMLHAWASESSWVQPYYSSFWAFPLWSIAQVLLIGCVSFTHTTNSLTRSSNVLDVVCRTAAVDWMRTTEELC